MTYIIPFILWAAVAATFTVDAQGKVQLQGAGKTKYDLTRGDGSIKLKGRGLQAERDRELTVTLDAEGRASTIEETFPGMLNQLWPMMTMGVVSPVNHTKTHLTYEGGKCSVEKLTNRDKLVVDSRMCNELRDLFKTYHTCKSACDGNIDGKSAQIVSKYKGSLVTLGDSKLEKSGERLPYAGAVSGQIYLARCANRVIEPSMERLKVAAGPVAPSEAKSSQ